MTSSSIILRLLSFSAPPARNYKAQMESAAYAQDSKHAKLIWGVPKIRGTILGVPIIRIIIFWGLYWGPLLLGNYH